MKSIKKLSISAVIIISLVVLLRSVSAPVGDYFRSNGNFSVAKAFWEIGRFFRDDESIQQLGFHYWANKIDRDPEKSLSLLLSIPGYENRRLTRLMVIGVIYGYQGDSGREIDIFRYTCSEGLISACALLSYALFKNGDYEGAKRHSELVESKGRPNIDFLISVLYLNGLGYEKDQEKAMTYMERCSKHCTFMKDHAIKALALMNGKSEDFKNVHDYYYWKDYFE